MKSFLVVTQLVLIALTVIFFVKMAVGTGATRATGQVWREIPRRPVFRMAVGIWLSVFLFDLFQTDLDHQLTKDLGNNFTHLLYQFEGNFVASMQQFLHWKPLTYLLAFAYMILFPGLIFGSAHAFDRMSDHPRLRMTAYVYALNYLFCLPFYLLFPVMEPCLVSESRVLALCDSVTPHLINIIRPMSGVDNCFPSYHTSLTVSLVLIAWSGTPRGFRNTATVCGFLIVFSTMYLGFHWVLDVVFGVLAGSFVYAVSRRLVYTDVPVPVTVTDRGVPQR